MVKSSMRRKFIIIFSAVILAIILILQAYNYNESMKKIDQNERNQVQYLENSISEKMEAQIRVANHSLLPYLYNEEVTEMFAERDRDGLLQLVNRGYAELEANGISQMQFHEAPARSFLRVHDPDTYGDDLSDFRHTVVEANESVETISGLEEGVAGYGFRVVAPVMHNNEHIGSVEVGTDFETGFLERIREEIAGDYYIYSFENSEESLAATIDSTDSFPVDEAVLEEVAASGESTYITSEDDGHLIAIVPFVDYAGNTTGYIKGVTSRADIVSEIKTTGILTILGSVISILVMIVISYFMINSITQPIRRVAIGMDAVANKDLTVEKIEVKSKDEIALLVNSLDQMVANLRNTLETINDASSQVAASSEQLLASSEETSGASESVANSAVEAAESTEEQLEHVNTVTSMVGTMIGDMERMVADSRELITKTDDVNDSINDGNKSVDDIVSQMNEINSSVNELGAVIGNLSTRANEIDEIVHFITDISEQTNLLALNAAIEAARAGEYGQGFAVVADEVRKLAEQSSESTAQITNVIKTIRTDVDEAVEMIRENTEKVSEGIEKTHSVESAFELIESTIGEVSQFTNEVANTVQTLGDEGTEVEEAIDRIRQAAETNAIIVHENSAASEEQMAAVEEITAASEHLAKLAEDLRNEINTFKF